MISLHLIRTSAFTDNKFSNALKMIKKNDKLVLIDDGVYNVNHPVIQEAAALIGDNNIFVIEHHYQARGLLLDGLKYRAIDKLTLVDIIENSDQTITWQ